MNPPSKIALVYPYFETASPGRMLFPPLGIATLASQLEAIGLDVQIFDCTFLSFDRVVRQLAEYKPAIVGIYSMVSISRNAFRIAERLRENLPDSLLVAGGPMPTLYPDQYLKGFDIVFKGEADLAFPRFCKDYIDREIKPDDLYRLELNTYDGISVKVDGKSIDQIPKNYPENQIQTFPLPDRSQFDHTSYQEFWKKKDGTRTTSLITTFGCPYNCDFCSKPVFGNLFRRRNLDTVFAEIDQIKAHGYDTLWIADDNFTLDQSFLNEFCERIDGRHLRWSCLSRVSGITPATAQLMKSAGCHRVYLGLESGCQDTLKLMNKRATLAEGENAIRIFQNAGVGVAGFFIVGYPDETPDSIEKTFKFALSQPFDEISFNVPYPLPGSGLYERVKDIKQEEDWQAENEVSFLFDTEFNQQWMKRRIEETMAEFNVKHS